MRIALMIAAAGVMATGTVAAQGPASNRNIESKLERTETGFYTIRVLNHSSQNIIVTSVRLTNCENVRGACAVHRKKVKVFAGSGAMVHRVMPRQEDRGYTFRYTYTWEPEQEAGPSAEDVERDATALTVDSLVIEPAGLEIAVGETLTLGQVVGLRAWNSAGQPLRELYFRTTLLLGGEYLRLEGGKVTGLAPGTAALSIGVSTVRGPKEPSERATARLLVIVKP